MRFLHTSDLHLGKRMGEISLLEDQRFILDQIRNIVIENECDAIVIAGDIYQRTDPSAESMTLFSDFIYDLSSKGIAVIAVSGNHDSGLRLSYLSRIIRRSGIYFSEVYNGAIEKITLESEGCENVNFFLMPFIRPVDAKRFFPDEDITNYNDAVKCIVDRIETEDSEINIMVAHQFITGASTSDSEEVFIGGIDNVDSGVFDRFDYVALGHLHKPQEAGKETVRYSGSPLKYSISEADNEKSCVIVDIKSKNDLSVKVISLTPLRDVRDLKGSFADLIRMPYSEDFVRVEINDEEVSPDARIILSETVFPNMIRFAVNNSKTSVETDIDISENVENRSILDLFNDFYSLQNNGVRPDEERIKVLTDIIQEFKETDNNETN